MKRFVIVILIISVLFSSCQHKTENSPIPDRAASMPLKAVWFSCYDYPSAAGKTREEYETLADKVFSDIADCGFNTAFVHLRAFSDSFYDSDVFPYSAFIAGSEGAELPFDPFEVILESAKKYGIGIHGWINPFRVSHKSDPTLLSESNPAKLIYENGNENGRIYISDKGIYYNPADAENQKLVIDGVREILKKYNISGIHIDDYFYPSQDSAIDKLCYEEYVAEVCSLSLSEWRIKNINALVQGL